jgi:hypothetical protein
MAGRWNGVARQVLRDRRSVERGILDRDGVERLLDAHRSGVRRGGDAIWALLNLELWYRTFIDRDGVQTLPAPEPVAGRTAAPRPAAGARFPGPGPLAADLTGAPGREAGTPPVA